MASTTPVVQHDPTLLFMQQLGIHPAEQIKFSWLAEYGLKEEALPPRWTMHMDRSSGHVYYVDRDTHSSSWDNPLTPALRRVLETARLYLQQPTDNFFEERKRLLWHQHKWEIECWCGPFKDSAGRSYFANSVTGVSSWRDPREETQYIFELEIGLIGNVQEMLPQPRELSAILQQHGATGQSDARQRQATSEAWAQMQELKKSSSRLIVQRAEPVPLKRPEREEPFLDGFKRVDGAEILQVSESRLPSPATEVMTVESWSGSGTIDSQENRVDDSLENRVQSPEKLQAAAQNVSILEHKREMDKLGSAAKWLHGKNLEEAEDQRSLLLKKMRARQLRKLCPTSGDDITPGIGASLDNPVEASKGAAIGSLPGDCIADSDTVGAQQPSEPPVPSKVTTAVVEKARLGTPSAARPAWWKSGT